MKSEKGILLIDALLALMIVMVVANITFSFISVYYHFDKLSLKEVENEEEESGLDFN